MSKHRRSRINDAVTEELAVALRSVRDPRITDSFVSISRAEVTGDLRNATVYFSCMGDAKETQKALEHASGLFRRHLAQTLNLRITPELIFRSDNSIEHGARIAQILKELGMTGGEGSAREENEDDE